MLIVVIVSLEISDAVMFSCSEGEQAFEDKEKKHSIFFYYVMEGLKGRASKVLCNSSTSQNFGG